MKIEKFESSTQKETGRISLRTVNDKWLTRGIKFLLLFEVLGGGSWLAVRYGIEKALETEKGRDVVSKGLWEFDKLTASQEEKQLLETLEKIVGRQMLMEIVEIPEEHKDENVEISGFEKFGTVGAEDIQALLNYSIPDEMLKNVKRVSYDDHFRPMPTKDYGVAAGEQQAAYAAWSSREIVVTKGSQQESISWIIGDMLPHEIGHLNDWHTPRLSRFDRLMLLGSVAHRVTSPDRFKSSYVEAIENPDKKREAEIKCVEYFAEIFSAYLSPTARKTLPVSDVIIIGNYIHRISPGFDIKKADNERLRLINKSVRNYNRNYLKNKNNHSRKWKK